MSATTVPRTAEAYGAAFEQERARVYPMVDAIEASCGYALDRGRLESAARVLACPLKKNPPNWQHGRVLYALTRKYLDGHMSGWCNVLDIGTAKGFSALCLRWALDDHDDDECGGGVVSVDVVDPHARVARNTVADLDGLLTLEEILQPWPDAKRILFVRSTGLDWLERDGSRIHVAFVDGSHKANAVAREGALLQTRQERGDLAIFDDVHRPDVLAAVAGLDREYHFDFLEVLPDRSYAIGVRR